MTPEQLIAHRNAEIARLEAMRAALTKPGAAIGMRRWGTSGPFDQTRQTLAEIDRQIADLRALNEVIRSGGLLTFRQALAGDAANSR
jgi:hypothetical protein